MIGCNTEELWLTHQLHKMKVIREIHLSLCLPHEDQTPYTQLK